MSGINPEPENVIEGAADAAMKAAEEFLAEHDATVKLMYVALWADGLDEDRDGVTAATGSDLPLGLYERAATIFPFLIGEAAATAKVLGVRLKVFPVRGGEG